MDTNKACFAAGLIFATIAAISGILAFSMPNWIYTYDLDSKIGIERSGLWEYCLNTFFDMRYNYNSGKPMYGCNWIYGDYLKEIRWTVLNPVWMIVVQIMAVINLILSLLGLIGLYIICFVRQNNCPLIFGIISMFFCTALGFCEVVLYAIRVRDPEYYKVPNVKAKSLGAGWGFAVIASIVSLCSLISLTLSYLTIRKERRRLRREERESQKSLEQDAAYGSKSKSAMRGSY